MEENIQDEVIMSNFFKLIYRIATETFTLKKVEMEASYLNYYVAFAGTAYQFLYSLMRHWQSIMDCQWYFPILINVFSIDNLFFNCDPSIIASKVHPLILYKLWPVAERHGSKVRKWVPKSQEKNSESFTKFLTNVFF